MLPVIEFFRIPSKKMFSESSEMFVRLQMLFHLVTNTNTNKLPFPIERIVRVWGLGIGI